MGLRSNTFVLRISERRAKRLCPLSRSHLRLSVVQQIGPCPWREIIRDVNVGKGLLSNALQGFSFEMRWKIFGETATEEEHMFSLAERGYKRKHGV